MSKFPKAARLKTAHDFLGAIRKGQKISSIAGMIVFVLSNDLGFARIGISIRKMRVKNATERNRLKRIIREQFRVAPRISADIVIVVQQELAAQANAEIRTRLIELWQQIEQDLRKK